VVVVSRRFPPVVAVRIAVASGSLRDPEGQEGRALLCWQTALRGTLQRTRAEQAETLESLGANLEVAVDKYGATLHGEVLLEHLPVWLSIAADVLLRPRFDPAEFAAAKSQLVAELVSARDDDDWLASDAISRYLYRGTPHGRPTTGTPESLAKVTVANCQALHTASVLQGQVRVGFAGPLDLASAEALVAASIGPLPKGKVAPLPPPAPATEGRRLLVIDKPRRTQAQVQLALQTVGVRHPDFLPLVVANAMLGGAFTSRLNNEIREQRGWSYGVGSALQGGPDQTAWTIQLAPGNAVAVPAVDLAVQIAGEMQRYGLTAKELQFTKDFLIGSQQLALETAERELAQRMRGLELGLPEDEVDRFAERIRAVTVSDIQKALKRHVKPENLVAVVVGSAADLREKLAASKSGFAVEVIAADARPEVTTLPGLLPGQSAQPAAEPEVENPPDPGPHPDLHPDEDAELPDEGEPVPEDPDAP
jgi:zinc protease